MATLFFGIQWPNKTYERVKVDNIDFQQPVQQLKEIVSVKLKVPKDEMNFIYCGQILTDDTNLSESNVKPYEVIHIFKKTKTLQPYESTKTYTDEDFLRIANLFADVTGAALNPQTRINVVRKVLTEYPEFRRNLAAQAIIRDPVLFNTLGNEEVIKKIAKNYTIICDAAEFIVKTIRQELAKDKSDPLRLNLAGEDNFSYSSSSSEDENTSNPRSQSEHARIRRISRNQLETALMLAGTASLNSLSNIAQRNANIAEEHQEQDEQGIATGSGTSNTPGSSSGSRPGRISSSVLNNALAQALMAAASYQQQQTTAQGNRQNVENMDVSEPEQVEPDSSTFHDQASRFSEQLQLMREMGLMDENLNIQALLVSNGDVEAAVMLVLNGGLNSN